MDGYTRERKEVTEVVSECRKSRIDGGVPMIFSFMLNFYVLIQSKLNTIYGYRSNRSSCGMA